MRISDWSSDVCSSDLSNLGLERHLAAEGLNLLRTRVGDRHVLEAMRRDGYNVGGEQSGHIILSDYATTGDGLVASLQILGELVQAGAPAREVLPRFDPLPPRSAARRVGQAGVSPFSPRW